MMDYREIGVDMGIYKYVSTCGFYRLKKETWNGNVKYMVYPLDGTYGFSDEQMEGYLKVEGNEELEKELVKWQLKQ